MKKMYVGPHLQFFGTIEEMKADLPEAGGGSLTHNKSYLN